MSKRGMRAIALALTKSASQRGRRMLDRAPFKQIDIQNGKIAEVSLAEPFDILFLALVRTRAIRWTLQVVIQTSWTWDDCML